MAIMALGALGAAALGAASSNSNINKSIDSQREENERTRQYNLGLASKQNQWSIDQWNRENSYNNPSNQMARLRAAGLNPDLIYGQGAGALTSASSPSITSGAPAQSTDTSRLANKRTLGDILQQSLSTRQAESSINVANAQARNIDADTRSKDITNTNLDDILTTGLKKTNSEITALGSSANLSDQQRTNLTAQLPQIEKQIELYETQIEKLKADMGNLTFTQAMARVDQQMKLLLNDATIFKLAADTGLSRAQTTEIMKTLPLVVSNLFDQGENIRADTQGKYAQADYTTNRSRLTGHQINSTILEQNGIQLRNGLLSADLNKATYEMNTRNKSNAARDTLDKYTGGLGSALEIINYGIGRITGNLTQIYK